MQKICDLCRSAALDPVYRPDGSNRQLSVHICTHCGLVQSLPRIDGAPASVPGRAGQGRPRFDKGCRSTACLSLIRARADLTSSLRLLDVGSDRGIFARTFLDAAPRAQLTAVEPDERVADACAFLARSNLIPERIEHAQLPDETFDIVHSCHTIEQLASPLGVLADHWRTLKPGGLLVVDAPNIAAIGGNDIVEEWFVDKNLFHFSAVTLARLLDASGFTIVDGPDSRDNENLLYAAVKRTSSARPVRQDVNELETATAIIGAYKGARGRNLSALNAVSLELGRLAPRGLALWGAGRLFDLLVSHGGFDPKLLTLLIDTHLGAHVPSRHGVFLSGPEALGRVHPSVIVVMSGAFAGEISRIAAKHTPQADVLLYSDLIARARHQLAA